MPYTSQKQRAWAHTDAGTKALGGPAKVHEWDQASKGKDLPVYSKGTGAKGAKYAKGGPVTGRTREFMKEPVPFRTDIENQSYGKSGKEGMPEKDKSLTPVKPRT